MHITNIECAQITHGNMDRIERGETPFTIILEPTDRIRLPDDHIQYPVTVQVRGADLTDVGDP